MREGEQIAMGTEGAGRLLLEGTQGQQAGDQISGVGMVPSGNDIGQSHSRWTVQNSVTWIRDQRESPRAPHCNAVVTSKPS